LFVIQCNGDLDTDRVTTSCDDGWAADVASCAAAPTAKYCDGEVTTCQQCASKSEFFLGKCNWCPDDGKCWGNTDGAVGGLGGGECKSKLTDQCSSVTVDPNYKFDCAQCERCNLACQQTYSNGLTFCLRGELQIIGGQCKTDKDANGCCAADTTPQPPPPAGTLRSAFSSICFEYSGGCTNALDFCSYKARYLSCATGSDRCSDYNSISTMYDNRCPQIKCQCSAVPNPCLPMGERVTVTCSVSGAAPMDNCSACKDCSCEQRCCTTKCSMMDGKVVQPFKCDQNNGVTKADCKCAKGSDSSMIEPALMGALSAATAMLI
jgi:hypothetical protein